MKNTSKIFDGLLVLEYQSGNKKALSLLVNKHHHQLCKQSFWYTKNAEASKDIVQDCWSIIMKKLGNLKDPNSFRSWATKIVIRKSLDAIKKDKKTLLTKESYYVDVVVDGSEVDKESQFYKLTQAIKELPLNQQTVLKLFYIEEYSLNEICEIMEVSIGTIKSRLFHAREKLKTILKKQ